MHITRKLIFPVAIIILIAFSLVPKINAENTSTVFNGDKVLVLDNGFEFEIKAYGDTIDEALKNAGITLHEEDIIFPNITNNIQKIIILRSKTIYLNIYGDKKEFVTSKNKVEEVLEEMGIKIAGEDLINYSLTTEIFSGMEIQIQKKPTPPPPLPKPKPKPAPAPVAVSQNVKTGEAQSGVASWYSYVSGNYCASLKFHRGSKLLVTNVANGKSVIVTVNDKGPFSGKIIDLERNAFSQIGSLSAGIMNVTVEKIY